MHRWTVLNLHVLTFNVQLIPSTYNLSPFKSFTSIKNDLYFQKHAALRAKVRTSNVVLNTYFHVEDRFKKYERCRECLHTCKLRSNPCVLYKWGPCCENYYCIHFSSSAFRARYFAPQQKRKNVHVVKLPYISIIIGNEGDRGHWPLPRTAQSISGHDLPPLSLTRPANYSHMNCPPDLKRTW